MRRFLALFLLLTLTSCTTIEYRRVQSDFESAAYADNQRVLSPFTDANASYAAVLDELTTAYIARLDERLQPNAWMLRAVAAWRSGEYEDAITASEAGLRLRPVNGSRDSIILTAVPGLVFESQALDTWKASDKSRQTYEGLKEDMSSAWAKLKAAEDLFRDVTPPSTKAYVYFQQWRVAWDWRQMIVDVEDASGPDRQNMRDWAESKGGVDAGLTDATKEAKDNTKGPLRELIDAMENLS